MGTFTLIPASPSLRTSRSSAPLSPAGNTPYLFLSRIQAQPNLS